MKFRYENLMAAIFWLLAVNFAQAAQSAYSGKTLSDWLILNIVGDASSPEAVRQIGTNGIPTLIDLLSVKNENVKKILSKLHDKNLTYYYRQDEDFLDSQENLRKLGVAGFAILGTNAESAVPQITKIFNEYDSETMFQAGCALTEVRPEGFFVLTNALNNTNAGVRDVVVQVIGKYGDSNPEVVRQLLIHALQDPHPLVRLHAAGFLRGKEPDLVIPAMIPLLSDNENDYEQCLSATETLIAYGPAAKSAAPKLLSVFTNIALGTNQYLIKNLSGFLLNGLRKIDTDTAAKAEEFILNGGPLGVVDNRWTDTLLLNGKELIVGGFFQTKIPTKTDHVFSRAQLFDPVTGKRTETGSMNVARYAHMAILLRNGKVLVAGGEDDKGNYLFSAELYDLNTGTWTETGKMKTPCVGGQEVLQPDGKVQIPVYRPGKNPGNNLYDPTTGMWTVITNK